MSDKVNREIWLLHMLAQQGDRYIFGSEASPLDPDPDYWDCSELVEWASARCGVRPTVPDGSANQYAHATRWGCKLDVPQAINTRGALLFIAANPANPSTIHHVAVSLGNGKTIEAKGKKWGVGVFGAPGRFNLAALLAGIDYYA